MKSIFTTGEAAEICGVSQQTIIRCFDSGRLKGFKVPGSKFRRIPRAALIEFMKEHNIPVDELESGKPKVLVVGSDCPPLTKGKESAYEIKSARSGYEAGLLTHKFSPDVILVGVLDSDSEPVAICKAVRQSPELKHIRIVVSGRAAGKHTTELRETGAVIADDSTTIDGIMEQLV